MLANVGIKIYIALKSAVSAVLKGVFKNLIKPYIKSYIDQKEVLRGGDITSLLCCSDFIPSLYIFFRVKVIMQENVGQKSIQVKMLAIVGIKIIYELVVNSGIYTAS